MSKELTTQDGNNFLALIEKIATSKDVDVEKMKAVLDMQERVLDKQAVAIFNNAMSELQPEMPQIFKSKTAHNSRYAPYEEIDKRIRPFYTKHGFSPAYNTRREEDGTTTYFGILSHRDGHKKEYEINLKDDGSGSKNTVQAKASSLSYAKRYLLQMMFNVVTTEDDNDANYYITNEQAVEIDLLVKEVDINKAKFLMFLNADNIQEIREQDYNKAMNAIDAKRSEK